LNEVAHNSNGLCPGVGINIRNSGGEIIVYYGHSSDSQKKSDWQLLADHLSNVANLSAEFADAFNGSELAYLSGMLHDIGKYSDSFQKRLEGATQRVDHSTAGAQEAVALFGDLWGRLLAYIIAGHHGGMPDWEDSSPSCLRARLMKNDLKDYSAWRLEVQNMIEGYHPKNKLEPQVGIQGFQLGNYIRMIYSCLVDADFLDTEKAFGSMDTNSRGKSEKLSELLPLLENELSLLSNQADDSAINIHRRDILSQCIEAADYDQGLFTLTVPTGGGKTLSSMAFAINHAIKNGMNRVIYVIPYTSIIEQNARIFKNIFGENNVLEHHSNFEIDSIADESNKSTDNSNLAIRLATQNWDAPIIVTTNVQFFESFFSNKPSKCRKLHNVAKSVVILDEAQMLPVELLKPSAALLGELALNYKTSVVLCTATQPSLNEYFPKQLNVREIVKSPSELYESFRRIKVELLDSGETTDDKLADRIREHHQVLCVVNTRNHANRLYTKVGESEGTYHLSARMCPAHRRVVLREIKMRLISNEECKVISTQLIEAGVDVDFPVVYRSMAGIDSIAQSAGRCNREGRLETGKVYAFEPEKHGIPKGYMSLTASKARSVFRNFPKDPMALDAISSYFDDLYKTQDDRLDRKKILQLYEEGAKHVKIQFHEIAQKYQLIENGMKSLIVPYKAENSEEDIWKLIENLRFTKFPGAYHKKLQKFTIQVYPHEFKLLDSMGGIECIQGAFNVLILPEMYSNEFGLMIPNQKQSLSEILVF
jgi:CRISPR-associated helicase Cas3/CRISPR-associated endonuclease Cas3-HD